MDYVDFDLRKWEGEGSATDRRVALHEPLQCGVRFAGGWIVCRMDEVWMVSLEKRGRRVGGWDHGSTIETWRGLFGCSVFREKLVLAILESHREILPMLV